MKRMQAPTKEGLVDACELRASGRLSPPDSYGGRGSAILCTDEAPTRIQRIGNPVMLSRN